MPVSPVNRASAEETIDLCVEWMAIPTTMSAKLTACESNFNILLIFQPTRTFLYTSIFDLVLCLNHGEYHILLNNIGIRTVCLKTTNR